MVQNSWMIQQEFMADLNEAIFGKVGNTDDDKEFYERLVLGIQEDKWSLQWCWTLAW